MAQLDQYTYVFVIGTFFAMLDAYNNGASEYPAPPTLLCFSMGGWMLTRLDRRCGQRVGDECVVEVHLVQTGHGLRHHL